MTDIADPAVVASPPRKGKLLKLLLPLIALAGGFASTYMGLWSPMGLVGGGAPAAEQAHDPLPAVTFADVPRIVLTIPGERTQTLAMTVMIEVPP